MSTIDGDNTKENI